MTDVLHAFGVDSHGLGECIAKIIRSGRKDGESSHKDLTKALEHLRRHIELIGDEAYHPATDIIYLNKEGVEIDQLLFHTKK